MQNITFKEAKELFDKHNKGRNYGIVFDALLETIVDLLNKKQDKPKSKKKETSGYQPDSIENENVAPPKKP